MVSRRILAKSICRNLRWAWALAAAVMTWNSACPARASSLTAQQRADILEEAQQAYDRGMAIVRSDSAMAQNEFHSAATRFQLVADSGVLNGRLFYNLGNAYLQTGDLGRAILNYRRAQTLIPSDARLRSNLAYARSLCRSRIEYSGADKLHEAVLGWHDQLPFRWRFGIFVVCHTTLWLSLAATALFQLRPRGLKGAALLIGAAVWLFLGASIAADLAGWRGAAVGVLLVDDVVIRKGNGLGFDPIYEQPLHAGVEFTVVEKRGEWMLIRLANRDEGWIEYHSAGLVERPSYFER